jgi:RNA binding exosome subunit
MSFLDGPAVKSQIQAVEVAYFVHVTEDPEKLGKAVAALVGLAPTQDGEPLEGHFGNRIIVMKIRAVGDEAESAARRVFASMPREMKREILSGLGSFVDEHSALFLRFDKQLLVQGRLAMGSGDPVRVKVKPRLFRIGQGALEFYRNLLEGPHAS